MNKMFNINNILNINNFKVKNMNLLIIICIVFFTTLLINHYIKSNTIEGNKGERPAWMKKKGKQSGAGGNMYSNKTCSPEEKGDMLNLEKKADNLLNLHNVVIEQLDRLEKKVENNKILIKKAQDKNKEQGEKQASKMGVDKKNL